MYDVAIKKFTFAISSPDEFFVFQEDSIVRPTQSNCCSALDYTAF